MSGAPFQVTSHPETCVNAAGFEGPEKHLELDFRPRSWKAPVGSGLLGVPDAEWAPVLSAARVHVLSIVGNEHVRMFLLSESSMFVMKSRVIIKTCGTTTLLNAIEPIRAVASTLGFELSFIAFHRRDYIFPDAQPAPHTNFEKETEFLSGLFPSGKPHVFGSEDGPRSYLWMATLPLVHSQSSSPTSDCTPTTPSGSALAPWDAVGRSATLTLEVMMTDVHPDVLAKFHRHPNMMPSTDGVKKEGVEDVVENSVAFEALQQHPSKVFFSEDVEVIRDSRALGVSVTKETGIDELMPRSVIDSYQFTPCGYSMNGIADDEFYWTIHVTPEEHCNFISFESSLPVHKHTDMVERVLRVFRPGCAIVRVLADKTHSPSASFLEMLAPAAGYTLRHMAQMDGGRNATVLFASLAANERAEAEASV